MKQSIILIVFSFFIGHSLQAQNNIFVGAKTSGIFILDELYQFDSRFNSVYGLQVGKQFSEHWESTLGLDWRSNQQEVLGYNNQKVIKGTLGAHVSIRYIRKNFYVGTSLGIEYLMRYGVKNRESGQFNSFDYYLSRFNMLAQSEMGYQAYLNDKVRVQVGPTIQCRLFDGGQEMLTPSYERWFGGLTLKVDYFLK